MSKNESRADMMAADQSLIDGIQKHQASLPPTLTAGSQTITLADVVTLLQGRIGTAKAVLLADAARTAAVKADRDRRAATQPQVRSVKNLIVAMYEESPDVLRDYGLAAHKPPTLTAQGKAEAAAKAAATRKAHDAAKKAPVAAAAPATPASPPASPAAPPAKSGS
jgi:hypothetical protein